MSRPAVKWVDLERVLLNAGCTVEGRGGDKVVRAPKGSGGTRNQITIGHTSCSKPGSQVLACYLNNVKRMLGIDLSELGW